MAEPCDQVTVIPSTRGPWEAACPLPAVWSIKVGLDEGPLAGPWFRCGEHIDSCVSFHLGEPTTARVIVERLT